METKACKSTRTTIGCGKEKPIESFKISSTNPNTGKVYRKSLCSQCEWRNQKKDKVAKKDAETVLYNDFDILMRG